MTRFVLSAAEAAANRDTLEDYPIALMRALRREIFRAAVF